MSWKYLIPVCVFALVGCGTSDQSTKTGEQGGAANKSAAPAQPAGGKQPQAAEPTSGAPASQPVPDPQTFLQEAVSGGLMEVELGRLAENKGQEASVKEFGRRMVDDHTQANKELLGTAAKLKLDVQPKLAPPNQTQVDRLTKLSGTEFDREYIKLMVRDHTDDVAAFENVASGSTEPQVKAIAQKILPVLREHLQLAQKTAQQIGVTPEAGGGNP